MTFSENLHKVTDRAKAAEEKAHDAQKRASENAQAARIDLETKVKRSGASAAAQAAKLRESAQASRDKLSGWWDHRQATWNELVTKVRHDVDDEKAAHDAKKAEDRADGAEVDAQFAIEYAFAAIEEAEYAVLDAILARAEAEDAHASA